MLEQVRLQFSLASLFEETRNIIALSRKLLKEPIPDMFLGRKTQEPFPRENKQPVSTMARRN